MKRIILFSFLIIFFSRTTCSQEHQDAPIQEELTEEGQRLIDTIFENARASVENREDLMTEEWLTKQKEIVDLRNLISDARIFSFDAQTENIISRCLASYIIQKTNEEIPHIFDIDGISAKRVKDFYAFSHTMCKLSGGIHCSRMIRTIESDNFDKMLLLKAQKTARNYMRKERTQQLKDALLFGGTQR